MRWTGRGVGVLVGAWALVGVARAQETLSSAAAVTPAFAVRLQDPLLGAALVRLLASAQDVVAHPECASLLDAFAGRDGRPLRRALDATGLDFARYLEWVVFYEGDGLVPCDRIGVFAVTSPGCRVVWICSPEARRRSRENPRLARATLIHEALHTLGLGEDPPGSREITERVLAVCR